MQSYIVRIYRRRRRVGWLLGVVERPGIAGTRRFTSPDELWAILTAVPSRGAARPRRPRPPPAEPGLSSRR